MLRLNHRFKKQQQQQQQQKQQHETDSAKRVLVGLLSRRSQSLA